MSNKNQDIKIPNKPVWMSREDYNGLLQREEDYRCIKRVRGECDCPEDKAFDVSIDHIVPRAKGGDDALSNYQILCKSANSSKGIKDDSFWVQNFYWDNNPNLEAFRTAQLQEGYRRILHYSDFFTRPFSEISRKLYILAWIVGAGKTMGIVALLFAINHIILREKGKATPRVASALILVKDSALRAQMVSDMENDIVRHGIFVNKPRVFEITDGSQFKGIKGGNRPDIAVACTQMLWKKNGQLREDVHEIFGCFQAVFFDEPHFAEEQTLNLVKSAQGSICFGLTGSPIQATGHLIKNYIKLSLYSYLDAKNNDGSLKYITDDEKEFDGLMVDLIDSKESHIRKGIEIRQTSDVHEQDYDINIEPSKSVVQEVIRFVVDRDKEFGIFASGPAEHRNKEENIADIYYDTHALIVADSVESAKMLCNAANDIFKSDPITYQAERGYRCEVVFGANKENKAKPLPSDHPWMLAKRNGGHVKPRSSARFLIAVDMVREGVDNPYCGVVGVACKVNSLVEVVQRVIGRQARTPVTRDENGTLHVPSSTQDTIKIITHRAFRNEDVLRRGLRFICNMEDWLSPLPTIDDLIEDRPIQSIENPSVEGGLSTGERIEIARIIGECKEHDAEVDRDWLADKFGGESPKRRKNVDEWVDMVTEAPDMALQKIAPSIDLRVRQIVERELPIHNVSSDDIIRFIKIHEPDLEDLLDDIHEDKTRRALLRIYQKHATRFHIGVLKTDRKLSNIRKDFAGRVFASLGNSFEGDTNIIYALAGSAMKQVLGVSDGNMLTDGSEWDTPQVVALLTKPTVRDEITHWVRRGLIDRGLCPSLNAVFRINTEVESDAA